MSSKNSSLKRKIIKSTIVCCPIIYGSIATHLGKKAEEFSTHKWKLYIRGPNFSDNLSSFIEKVAFTLHSSFQEPIREVSEPPFEVVETGWGEFEASIRIYFRDPEQQPVDLFHNIKLYPIGSQQPLNVKKSVVDEQYDEIVFTEPSEAFYQQLLGYTIANVQATDQPGKTFVSPPVMSQSSFHQQECFNTTSSYGSVVFDDSLDIERLASIEKHLIEEIQVAKLKLMEVETKIVETLQEKHLAGTSHHHHIEKQKHTQSSTKNSSSIPTNSNSTTTNAVLENSESDNSSQLINVVSNKLPNTTTNSKSNRTNSNNNPMTATTTGSKKSRSNTNKKTPLQPLVVPSVNEITDNILHSVPC